MNLAYQHCKEQSSQTAATLSAFATQHMQGGNEATMAEQLKFLGEMAAREELEWHFNFLMFRFEKCQSLVGTTAKAALDHIADKQTFRDKTFQGMLEALFEGLRKG